MSAVSSLLIDPNAEAISRLRASLQETRRDVLKPIIRQTPSEWAEANIVLSQLTSPGNPGPLRLNAFSRGILDAFVEEYDVLAFMKSAQIGYTLALAIICAYWMEHDPTTVLFYAETEPKANYFAQNYIEPIFTETPALAAIMNPSKQTRTEKISSLNSRLNVLTAVNDENLRSYNAARLIADEVESKFWRTGSSSGGNKLSRLSGRGQSVDDAGSLIVGSTPGEEKSSLIEPLYLRGDRRKFHVPCPQCGEMQALVWGGPNQKHGLRWDDRYGGEVYYRCVRGCDFTEGEDLQTKKAMIDEGEWRATATPTATGHISFHASALYSTFKKARWKILAEKYTLAAHKLRDEDDDEDLRVFKNENLGQTWKAKDGARHGAEPHQLQQSNVIEYPSQVPPGVRVITVSVDVQTGRQNSGGRFEVSFYGWGEAERGWLLAHFILDEIPLTDPTAWFALEDVLRTRFVNDRGDGMWAQAAAIDYGGHYGQQVSDLAARDAARPKPRRWWAIRGRGRGAEQRRQIWPRDPSKTKHGGFVYEIDTWRAKDILFQRLTFEPPRPGSISFPDHSNSDDVFPGSEQIDTTFFERLTREAPHMLRGVARWDGNQPVDQEPWDCLVYAYAALQGLKAFPNSQFAAMVAAPKPIGLPGRPASPAPDGSVSVAAIPAPAPKPKPKAAPRISISPMLRR